jgi:rhodanese-related sulfurtransferase
MTRLHATLAAVAGVLALGAALVDARPSETRNPTIAPVADVDYMSALDLAERIARGDGSVRVVDMRSATEYAQFHIPTSVHMTAADLAAAALPPDAAVVLYSDDDGRAIEGWMLLRLRGHRHVFVLREGLYEWIARVHEPRLAADATPAERAEFERAAALSRFFGGFPRADVPRAEIPAGYWNTTASGARTPERTASAVAAIRRRGC